jgi:integrase
MGKRSTSGTRFLIRRSDCDLWAYHRNLAVNIAPKVAGEVELYWSGRTAKLSGKRAVAISLGTSDRREAKKRRDQVHGQVEQIVDRAMRQVRRNGDLKKAALSPDDLRKIADHFYADVLNRDDTGTTSTDLLREWNTATAAAERLRHLAEPEALMALLEPTEDLTDSFDPELLPILDRLLRPFGVDVAEADRRSMALVLARALKKAGNDLAARKAGKVIETPPPAPPPILKNDERREAGSGPASSMTLRECFGEFATKKLTNPRMITDYRTHITRFIDLVGDIPIGMVTKKMVFDYAATLEDFPVRFPESWRSRTTQEIITLAKGRPDLDRLSALTINDKALAAVKSMFSWAVRRQLIETNPATGVSLDIPKGEKPRLPLSLDDLRLIFSQGIFTRGERPQMGGEAAYWLPQIALYAGLRLEEAGQLRCMDIKHQDDVWFFDIVSDPGETSVKTLSSIRRVPVHPDLISRGLLDERARRMQAGDRRMFPLLTINKHGKYTAMFSKWWGKWMTRIGLTDDRFVFHSLRHSFYDRCQDCRIPVAVADAFMGHAKMNRNGYGVGLSLTEMNAYMQTLDWSPVFSKS